MKVFVTGCMLAIMFFSGTALAEVYEDYGTNILSMNYDYEQYKPEGVAPLPLSNHYDYDWAKYLAYKNLSQIVFNSAWSPDGEWIAVSAGVNPGGIFKVPVNGGDPVYLNNTCIEYGDYVLPNGLSILYGFSNDGSELYFSGVVLDEAQGTDVVIEDGDDSFSSSINYPVRSIKAIDMESGEISTFIEHAMDGYYSKDGNYFVYRIASDDPFEYRTIKIENLNTKDVVTITNAYCFQFTPDSKHVIYWDDEQEALWKISVNGGDPVKIPIEVEDSGKMYNFDIHPDGQWIVYQGGAGPRSKTTNSGNFSTDNISKLYACNMISGESLALFPIKPNTRMSHPRFSPDGTKLSFTWRDLEADETAIEIHVVDIALENMNKDIDNQLAVEQDSPSAFALNAPFPNPFNPTTTISFTLAEPGFAELAVFNSSGQKIRTLAANTFSAGSHAVVWDGRDDNGGALSSGVYFSRLTTGNTTLARRMTLLK